MRITIRQKSKMSVLLRIILMFVEDHQKTKQKTFCLSLIKKTQTNKIYLPTSSWLCEYFLPPSHKRKRAPTRIIIITLTLSKNCHQGAFSAYFPPHTHRSFLPHLISISIFVSLVSLFLSSSPDVATQKIYIYIHSCITHTRTEN
jgi:hypothetical protein